MQSVLGFPVSRAIGDRKPGNRPELYEGTGLPVSRASSGSPPTGKPKSGLPEHRQAAGDGITAVENRAGSREERRIRPSRIDPALKSWLDEVIIPSLVRSYIRDREDPKERKEPKRAPRPEEAGKVPLAIKPGGLYARHDSERKQ